MGIILLEIKMIVLFFYDQYRKVWLLVLFLEYWVKYNKNLRFLGDLGFFKLNFEIYLVLFNIFYFYILDLYYEI